jgi:hypothetical protein
MTVNAYDIGDLVRAEGHFTVAGVSTDPTTCVVKYQDPSGTVSTKTYGSDVEVVKDSTGRYHINISPNASGTWYFRFIGTGAAQAGGEQAFIVRASEF